MPRRRPKAPLPKPTVMIFTDASFSDQDGSAGWAAWVKRDGSASITKWGPIRAECPNPEVAETCAIANGLFLAYRDGLLRPGDIVMVQSDCAMALARVRTILPEARSNAIKDGHKVGVLKSRGRKPHPTLALALSSIKATVQNTPVSLQVRHVKGHSGKDDGRSWVNRQVDKFAKQGRKMRAEEMKEATNG